MMVVAGAAVDRHPAGGAAREEVVAAVEVDRRATCRVTPDPCPIVGRDSRTAAACGHQRCVGAVALEEGPDRAGRAHEKTRRGAGEPVKR